MRSLIGKRVLVTGAGRGIGRALSLRFATEGAELLLVDFDASLLPEVEHEVRARGRTARAYVLDVTDGGQIASVRARIHGEGGPIDVLVNNAGIVHGGAFLDVAIDRHVATFGVNVLGLVRMTHHFLPDLLSRPEGHLVNMSSASGLVGLPFGATYAASKWAVLGFSESIRLELGRLGGGHVHVTTVCPSYVATGLFEGVQPPRLMRILDAGSLADRIVRATLADKRFVYEPWLVKLTPLLKGIVPGRLFDAVARGLGVTRSMEYWRGRTGAEGTRP